MRLSTYLTQRKLQFLIVIMLSACLLGCKQEDPAYLTSIQDWHKARIDFLKSESGFVNLAGLYWIEEGENTFGSDSSNQIVFPSKSASRLGSLLLKNGAVYLINSDNVKIEEASVVDTTVVYNDTTDLTMSYKSLHWFVIKRGEDFGIRLRDFESPLLDSFDSIDYYPTDEKWKRKATWTPYKEPKNVDFQNMVGMTITYPVYGAFNFEIDGTEYSLEPLGEPEPEGYFVMFYDKTSGHTTYGSGRYLYVPEPDESGNTLVDFNKSFNPPCAFTEFATCLFPHKENRLPIYVNAGEKFSGH